MRVFLSAAALAGAALVGYLVSPEVSAQGTIVGQLQLVQGEKVRLHYEPDRGAQQCTVLDVRGEFVGCKNDGLSLGQAGYTRWYNLRHVVRIDRPQE